jgi:hypothetical protein
VLLLGRPILDGEARNSFYLVLYLGTAESVDSGADSLGPFDLLALSRLEKRALDINRAYAFIVLHLVLFTL